MPQDLSCRYPGNFFPRGIDAYYIAFTVGDKKAVIGGLYNGNNLIDHVGAVFAVKEIFHDARDILEDCQYAEHSILFSYCNLVDNNGAVVPLEFSFCLMFDSTQEILEVIPCLRYDVGNILSFQFLRCQFEYFLGFIIKKVDEALMIGYESPFGGKLKVIQIRFLISLQYILHGISF